MNIINPATNELIAQIEADSAQSISEKYHKLKTGQEAWKNTPLSDRIAIISRYAELVNEHLEDLAATLTAENPSGRAEMKSRAREEESVFFSTTRKNTCLKKKCSTKMACGKSSDMNPLA
jgi:acyl-CoA reductase-like NAD-dependent aldehyde dehydrogenase